MKGHGKLVGPTIKRHIYISYIGLLAQDQLLKRELRNDIRKQKDNRIIINSNKYNKIND